MDEIYKLGLIDYIEKTNFKNKRTIIEFKLAGSDLKDVNDLRTEIIKIIQEKNLLGRFTCKIISEKSVEILFNPFV